MGIRVAQGRVFDAGDNETSLRVAVVNETLARDFWPQGKAIGEELMPGVRIVGVVGDIRQEALDTRQGPAFYLPFAQRDGLAAAPNFVLVRTSGDPRALAPSLIETVRSIEPMQPVMDVRTMQEVLGRSVHHRRLLTAMMAAFAGLAVVLAIAGIYGVLSYIVSSQTREIGIRMCLGAKNGEVLGLVGRQLLFAVAVGIPAGVVLTLLASSVLSQWLFAVEANDPWTVLAAAVLTATAAVLGAMAPALRALRVDPMTAVRME
jgi:hypothetical protein